MICNSDETENVFGDGWKLLLALGRIKDIETRLVLGELVISNIFFFLSVYLTDIKTRNA